MAKIIAPNKQYTGLSASVSFVNGVGETEDPHLIDWFKSKSYTVEENKVDENPDQVPNGTGESDNPPNELGIDDITKDQIKEKLDELGIEYTSSENKDSLFEKLVTANEE